MKKNTSSLEPWLIAIILRGLAWCVAVAGLVAFVNMWLSLDKPEVNTLGQIISVAYLFGSVLMLWTFACVIDQLTEIREALRNPEK